ncbi:MAG: alpha/beta hydrolase [Lachnospiraceae bacterium]|nr:alpha/beta hydrolase [Lachnospiraceae bacterium]MCD7956745.1 alpha/beta hydrolase [Lachnospiraceae bacterium]
MEFAEAIQRFRKTHPFAEEKTDGISTHYLLCGKADARYTLVYLVGGTGISDVWFNHIIQMEEDYRILTFDYPMEINDLEQLADHIMKLIKKLDIKNPVLIGASLGGFMAQLIARRYSDMVSAVALYSTCSLSQASIADLKKQYKSYGVIMGLMKVVPYSWIKKMLFAVSKKQVGMENENPINRKYMEDFFAWIYGQYTKEFDLHMTGLILDVADIKPFGLSDYKRFDDKTLLVLPKADKAFSEAAQTDLLLSMPKAKAVKVEGGHTATLYKVDEYVRETREFLEADLRRWPEHSYA